MAGHLTPTVSQGTGELLSILGRLRAVVSGGDSGSLPPSLTGWITLGEAARLEGVTKDTIRVRARRKGFETRTTFRPKSPSKGNRCRTICVTDLSENAQAKYCAQLGRALLPVVLYLAEWCAEREGLDDG